MAHLNLHLAVGLAAGAAIGGVPVVRAWLRDEPIARRIAVAVVMSCALAGWAVVPQALTTLGAPASVHTAWWANVFVGHAAIDRRIGGGLLIGEASVAAYFAGVYVVVMVGLWRARRRGRRG